MKLGPRIIPFFKDIVAACVIILKDANDGGRFLPSLKNDLG
jgi:hypothetical protein